MDVKGFDESSPIFWLRDEFLTARDIPDPVKRRIARLYKQQRRYQVDKDTAQAEAHKLTCRIHCARIEFALAHTKPSDPKFLSLSKSAACWLSLLAKFNRMNGENGKGEKPKRRVPTSAMTPTEDEEHDLESDDADTA